MTAGGIDKKALVLLTGGPRAFRYKGGDNLVKTAEALVDEVLEQLPLEGPLTKDDVKVWWQWHVQIVNILEELGYYYRGESWKNQGWSTLLVLKVVLDGVPLVVFYTERDPTACMRGALRNLAAGTVAWRDDKFA